MVEDIISRIEPYPTMFRDEQSEELYRPIFEEELLEVMKSFKRDKCLGPDGWTIEFFLHFFELVKKDLLSMVDGSKTMGRIHQYISSTYIALIPKKKMLIPSQILGRSPCAIPFTKSFQTLLLAECEILSLVSSHRNNMVF